MAWKKAKKNSIEFLVLRGSDNYFISSLGDIDYKITTQEMYDLHPVNLFNDLYLGDTRKILIWDMAQSLFEKIKLSNPELIEEFDIKHRRE
jgi:hypothetical protein